MSSMKNGTSIYLLHVLSSGHNDPFASNKFASRLFGSLLVLTLAMVLLREMVSEVSLG